MTSEKVQVVLGMGTANIYRDLAEDLGLITNRGGGERGNITRVLTVLAQSLKDGTIKLDEFHVTQARLEPNRPE